VLIDYLVKSVTDLPDDRGRTARADEELAELAVDVLVTATHQECHVLDHAERAARLPSRVPDAE
jgi:hypothetical protein